MADNSPLEDNLNNETPIEEVINNPSTENEVVDNEQLPPLSPEEDKIVKEGVAEYAEKNKAVNPVVKSNPVVAKTLEENQLPKTSRYAKLEKSAAEYRSFSDRKINELTEKLKQLEERNKPLDAQNAKTEEEKRRIELAQLWNKNPLEAQRLLAEQAANAKLEPLQQYIQQKQNEEIADSSINYLKTTYGDQAFKNTESVMATILDNTSKNLGKEASDLLVQNPDALFRMAVGEMYIQNMYKQADGKAAGAQNQEKALRFANGTARQSSAPSPAKNSNIDYGQMFNEGKLTEKELLDLAYKNMR